MPTYQYACKDCEHSFEQVQSFSEDSLTVCPRCDGRLRKVFNAVGVVFKGSGFYRTDSRQDAAAKNGSESKPGDAAEKSADKSPEKSAEKPAEKSAEKSGAKPGTKSSETSGNGSGRGGSAEKPKARAAAS